MLYIKVTLQRLAACCCHVTDLAQWKHRARWTTEARTQNTGGTIANYLCMVYMYQLLLGLLLETIIFTLC